MQAYNTLGDYPNKAFLESLTIDMRAAGSAAMARYHARYDNALYQRATDGKTPSYANALIDEALALCGHPWYKLSRRRWGRAALEFLAEFVRQDKDDWIKAGQQFMAALRQQAKGR